MNRGTLITDDIHELELELELLKRKRLMVQQQQTLLASQQNYLRQPDFDYQQSSQQTNRRYDMSQEHNQTRNFSHLYDGPNQQHGLKRHAPDSAFHTNPPAKRFNGPQGGKPNKGPKGLPKPWDVDPIDTLQTMQRSINKPQSVMSFETFKKKVNFNPSVSRPTYSDFKPNKVTKPNVDNTPKYKSNPIPATCKGPVTHNNPVAQSSETTKKSHYEYVLRANDTPDNLVNGRMEFAMGHILKEIRVKFENVKKYSRIFNMAPQKETIKKILRQRIRCAMLDKVVGAGNDIIVEYRKLYPQHTDIEVLELTLLSCKETKIPDLRKQLEDPGARQYFVSNFNKLFDAELDKMFEKIKNLYMDEHKVNTKKTMQEIINDNIPTPVHVEISTTDNTTESGIKTTSKDESEPNKEPASEDSKVPADVTNADKQQDGTKLKEKRRTAIIDETKPYNDKDFEIYCAWKHYNEKFFQSQFYDKLIIFGIKQRLPEILPKERQKIMSIFEIGNMYKAAKEEIMFNTTKKINSTLKDNALKPATPAAAAEETTKPMDVSKYFVRVAGRPHLPNKKIMKEFLDKFNPTSIKKHRQLSYLLFVGFSNKEDYERLLQANGTLISNCRLLMTASDVSQSAKPCTDTNADDDVILVGENKTLDNSSDIISSDLDEQITDLLSSIRKAEEISETQSSNEEKVDTVAETQEPEVINLIDDTSSLKEDSESAPVADSQMQADDVNQERTVPGADAEPNKIHGDKLSVETEVTTESNKNQNDDLNTNKPDKSDNTKPDETKNEEANNTSPTETEEDTNKTEKENEQLVAEETIKTNLDTNKTENKTKPTVTEEITEANKDTNETEEKNKPTVLEEVIEIKDNDEEKTPIENKTVATVKETTKGTPVRASSRLANSTPSRVTTRRTSKLAQQNNQ